MLPFLKKIRKWSSAVDERIKKKWALLFFFHHEFLDLQKYIGSSYKKVRKGSYTPGGGYIVRGGRRKSSNFALSGG